MSNSRHFERFEVVAVRTYKRFQVAYLARWNWESEIDLDLMTDEDFQRVSHVQDGEISLEATTRDNYVGPDIGPSAHPELIPVRFQGHDAWPVGTVVEISARAVGEKGEVLDQIRANEDNRQKA